MNVLERKLTHVTSVPGAEGRPEVVITGANLRLVNGLRATATTNGLGNLVVGYNESREGENVRTGSHTVVGRQNEISGAFAAVSGGHGNTATSAHAAISGGEANTASGFASSVGGGRNHMAGRDFDWVAGSASR